METCNEPCYPPEFLPEVKQLFRCQVPVPNIVQAFLLDGHLQDKAALSACLPVSEGHRGLGMNMHFAPGSAMQGPLQIISVREKNAGPLSFSNNWTVERGARAQIIVCDHTLETLPFDTTRNTVINIEPDASLQMLFMQSEHNDSTYTLNVKVNMARNARLFCHIISLYGGSIENRVEVGLQGEGASCRIKGLFLADLRQRIVNRININHYVPNCYSDQLFKGIIDNQAQAFFGGLIKVFANAQKTRAYQANHNLILSPQAKMTTQPQLEIYADDVKCSHGASIGRLDELSLFYLRSRGISLDEARHLQQMAFVLDVLQDIPWKSIGQRIVNLVERRLRGEFSDCSHCRLHCC